MSSNKDNFSGLNLELHDDYLNEVILYLSKTANDAEEKLQVLLACLNKVVNESNMDGKTIEALKVLYSRANALSGNIGDYGEYCVKMIADFHEDIDKVDSALYNGKVTADDI